MRNLFLVRGLPGSGKTTLAETLSSLGPGEPLLAPMLAADDYFMLDGEYRFDPSKLPLAHVNCQESCAAFMEDGHEKIVVHNTFVCRWEMEPYIRIAGMYNYRVTVVSVFDGGLTDDELFARGKHGVPLEVIKRMRANYEHDWKNGDERAPLNRGK